MAAVTGSTRIPLTAHGVSFPLRDIDKYVGNERIPLLSGGMSVKVTDARSNGGVDKRIPILPANGPEGGWCTADDLMNYTAPQWTATALAPLVATHGTTVLAASDTGKAVGIAKNGSDIAMPAIWALATPATTPVNLGLGSVPSATHGSAQGIDRQANIAVGSIDTAGAYVPVLWKLKAANAVVTLGLPADWTAGRGIAAAVVGTFWTIVGNGVADDDSDHALLWTIDNGGSVVVTDLGLGKALAISDDGHLVLGADDSGNMALWTITAGTPSDPVVSDRAFDPIGMSGDGLSIVGYGGPGVYLVEASTQAAMLATDPVLLPFKDGSGDVVSPILYCPTSGLFRTFGYWSDGGDDTLTERMHDGTLMTLPPLVDGTDYHAAFTTSDGNTVVGNKADLSVAVVWKWTAGD